MECSPPSSSVHGILLARKLEWMPFPSPEDFPDTGIKPESPTLQAGSLPKPHILGDLDYYHFTDERALGLRAVESLVNNSKELRREGYQQCFLFT